MAHPDDSNGLNDWQTYGPRDYEIACLVRQLADEQNMRLSEIEDLIKTTLRERLAPQDRSQK